MMYTALPAVKADEVLCCDIAISFDLQGCRSQAGRCIQLYWHEGKAG